MQIPEANPAPPLLVALSGPSGVGKDAALGALKELNRPWFFPVTATTRPQRPNERHGVDYFFLDAAAFQRMIERDELIEYAQVYGNWYGVPRAQIREALKANRDVILKIDVQGAASIRRLAPEAVLVFMLPGSLDELKQRLTARMTENAADLERRLATACLELARVGEFDYRIVNRDGSLPQAVAEIDSIIAAEKCRVKPRLVQLM